MGDKVKDVLFTYLDRLVNIKAASNREYDLYKLWIDTHKNDENDLSIFYMEALPSLVNLPETTAEKLLLQLEAIKDVYPDLYDEIKKDGKVYLQQYDDLKRRRKIDKGKEKSESKKPPATQFGDTSRHSTAGGTGRSELAKKSKSKSISFKENPNESTIDKIKKQREDELLGGSPISRSTKKGEGNSSMKTVLSDLSDLSLSSKHSREKDNDAILEEFKKKVQEEVKKSPAAQFPENPSKIIGEGGYGCVYHPPPRCSDEKLNEKYGNPKYVLKYGDEDPDEIEMSKILVKIDPNQNYFIYLLPEDCEMINFSDIKKCKHHESRVSKKHTGKFMKYGGTSFYKYIRGLDEQNKAPSLNEVLRWFVKMLYAVKLLQENNIVHRDIKSLNMVILDGDIHMIDFGLGIMVDPKSNKNGNEFRTLRMYGIYPPFILIDKTFTDRLLIRTESLMKLRLMQESEKYGYRFEEYQDDRFSKAVEYLMNIRKKVGYPQQKEGETRDEWKKRLGKMQDDYYLTEIINKYIFNVDTWCLASAFFWDVYLVFNKYFKQENELLAAKFKLLLINMTHPDPREQWGMNEAVKYIQDNFSGIGESLFVKHMEVKEGKDIKKIQDYCSKKDPNSEILAYEDGYMKKVYCFSYDDFRGKKDLTINPQEPSRKLNREWIESRLKPWLEKQKIKDYMKRATEPIV